jgi:hypothetical protein
MSYAAGIIIGLFIGTILGFEFLSIMTISRECSAQEENRQINRPFHCYPIQLSLVACASCDLR